MKKIFSKLIDGLLFLGISLAFIYLLLFQTIIIDGQSMEPTLYHDDIVIAQKTNTVARDQVVIIDGSTIAQKLQKSDQNARDIIKRIVGMPGDKIALTNNQLYINDQLLLEALPGEIITYPNRQYQLETDEYFVLGDNSKNSLDSRVFGPIKREAIKGRALWLVYSPSR